MKKIPDRPLYQTHTSESYFLSEVAILWLTYHVSKMTTWIFIVDANKVQTRGQTTEDTLSTERVLLNLLL